jgi:hypothetical protein
MIVALPCLDDAIDVAVEKTGAERLLSLGVRVREVAANSDRPRGVHDPGGVPEVLLGEGSAHGAVAVESTGEGVGLLGRRGHALAVDRVEAAYRVAEEHPPERVAPQPFDVTALIGGEAVRHRLADCFLVGDEVGDDGRVELSGVCKRRAVVGGGSVAIQPCHRQDPALALDRQQHGEALRLGRADHRGCLPVPFRRASSPEHSAHVAGVDLDDRRWWRRIAPRGQPVDGAGVAPGGVDDEIRGDVLALAELHCDDPIGLGVDREPADVHASADVDVGQRDDPASNGPLQERTGHGRTDKTRGRPALSSAGLVPQEVAAQVDLYRAGGAELGSEAGEPIVQKPSAGGEQQVRMSTLRNQPPRTRVIFETVAVENDDACETIGKHTRGAEAGDAGSDHDCLRADSRSSSGCSHRCASIVESTGMEAASQDAATRASVTSPISSSRWPRAYGRRRRPPRYGCSGRACEARSRRGARPCGG